MPDFNDSLDAIFAGDTGPGREIERPAAREYIAKTTAPGYVQTCPRCRGTGRTPWGVCFKCKGARSQTFKTSPEARAKARDNAQARTAAKATAARAETQAWREANAAEIKWLYAAAERQFENAHKGRNVWDFPIKLTEALAQYGTLTDGQMEAVRKCIARDAARAAERAEKATDAPAVDTAGIDRLKAAFDQAARYIAEKGLVRKTPKITIGGITISPAKATSANPGALYVKTGQTYLGKIAQGRFFASRECGSADQARVQAFVTSPAEAAKVYGQDTGTCCICNATLKSEWRHRGIGPICAEKFGW